MTSLITNIFESGSPFCLIQRHIMLYSHRRDSGVPRIDYFIIAIIVLKNFNVITYYRI